MELRPALRPAGEEADDRVADRDVVPSRSRSSSSASAFAFASGSSASSCSSLSVSSLVRREQLLEPLARRMHLEPVAGVRRDERAPAAVRLDAQLALDGAVDHLLKLVLVEREPEMVDARQVPLAGLDDDVDRAALELGEPSLKPIPSSSSHDMPGSNDW